MRIRYTFIAAILAVMLLFVSTGCSSNNDNTEPAGTHTDETVQTDSPLTSETTGTQTSETASAESPVGSAPQATASEGYDVGDVMPDFSVPLVGGGTFTLSEHRGKPVFINLFATWCGPCVGEMPDINKLYGEYGDSVTFIAIDMGEDEGTAKDFADTNGYSLPFAHSDTGAPFTFLQFIPDTFVLDANGVIVAFYEGAKDYDTFKADIETAQGQ